MAGTENDDAAIGCGGLIALAIVLYVIAFVLERWQFLLGAAVVAGALILTVRAGWDVSRLRAHGRGVWGLREAARPTALHQEVEARDAHTAWDAQAGKIGE